MSDLPAIREALSWNIAATFARRHPHVEVHRSLLPEGVGYDTLVMHADNTHLALLNRGGRAHIGDESFEWERVLKLGVYGIVERIESANGMAFVGKRPPTTPRVLTYRTISGLLTGEVLGSSSLMHPGDTGVEVEPCHWDDSWDGSPATWVSEFREVNNRLAQSPCQHHFWHVKGRDMAIAFDARSGEAWTSRGEQLDLSEMYSNASRKFDAYMQTVQAAARATGVDVTPKSHNALALLGCHLADRGIAAPPRGVAAEESIRLIEHSQEGRPHLRIGTTDVHAWGAWDGDFEYVYQPLLEGHQFFAQAGQLLFLLASAGPLAVWTMHHLEVTGESAITNTDAVNRTWVRVRALLDAAAAEPTERPTHLLMLSGEIQYGVIDLEEVRKSGELSETAYTRCQSEDEVLQFGARLLRDPIPGLFPTASVDQRQTALTDIESPLVTACWGPTQEGESTPFEYRCSYDDRTWNRGLFQDPMFELDLLDLLRDAPQAFSITFAGEGGTPVWISGTRGRGRLTLETGHGHPGDLHKPKKGGVGQLLALGWQSPADASLGGFTAVLPETDAASAVSLILGTLQSSAYGSLHTIWWVWPHSLARVVIRAQDSRKRIEAHGSKLNISEVEALPPASDHGPDTTSADASNPSAADVDLATAAWQQRVGQIETVLSFFGTQFTIEVERADGVTVYVQGRRTSGTASIEVEAISNEFLPDESQLTPAQSGILEALGWDAPDGPGSPNFTFTIYDPSEEAIHALAEMIGTSLAKAYGVQSDDEWAVTPAEFGSSVGDLVDPELFDIFGEGRWFNWAWKSASQYARLPRAVHEVLLFVLSVAKTQAHSGPYRDGTTGALGLPHVAGAELMNDAGRVVARGTAESFAVRLPATWANPQPPQAATALDGAIVDSGMVFGTPDPGFVEFEIPVPDVGDSAAVSAWILAVRDLALKAALNPGPPG